MAVSKSIVRNVLRVMSLLCFCGLEFLYFSQPRDKKDNRWSTPLDRPVGNATGEGGVLSRVHSLLKTEPPKPHSTESKTNAGKQETITEKVSSDYDAQQWFTKSYTDAALDIRHFTRSRVLKQHEPEPNILILVMTKDASSWGSNSPSPSRTFLSFLSLLHNSSLALSSVSLGLLTTSQTEFETYKDYTIPEPFARVSLVLHPGYSVSKSNKYNDAEEEDMREKRHVAAFQHARRAEMAKLRNYLMLSALGFENYVFWFDADVYAFSDGLIPAMLSHMTDPKVGILTVRSTIGEWDGDTEKNESRRGDYDLNSWRGPRTKPTKAEKKRMRVPAQDEIGTDEDGEEIGIGSWTASTTAEGRHLSDLVQNTNNDELVRLDAVGGTVLLIRSSLVRQGLVFSPVYLVGLDWENEGWDGIETEGLCIFAKSMNMGCYGVGGDWRSLHSTD